LANTELGNLTSIAAAVAALITALGGLAVTGVLERAQRDEPGWLFAAFVLVVIAALFWLASANFKTGENAMKLIAFALFAGGLLVGILAVFKTQGTTPVPSVTASLDEKGLLTGAVKAESLKSGDVIGIRVEGLIRKTDPATKEPGWDTEVISSAFLGPDLNGKVDAPIAVLIPTGTYESVGVRAWSKSEGPCRFPIPGVRAGGAGCRVLPLAEVPKRPPLSLRWTTDEDAVDVGVHASNSPKDQLISVRVRGRVGRRSQYLARTLIEPSSRGVVDADWQLPVPKQIQTVCAEARYVAAAAALPPLVCPLTGGGPARAIAELRRP
jgi:hypothetical protein